jgi:hypothetical protein
MKFFFRFENQPDVLRPITDKITTEYPLPDGTYEYKRVIGYKSIKVYVLYSSESEEPILSGTLEEIKNELQEAKTSAEALLNILGLIAKS